MSHPNSATFPLFVHFAMENELATLAGFESNRAVSRLCACSHDYRRKSVTICLTVKLLVSRFRADLRSSAVRIGPNPLARA